MDRYFAEVLPQDKAKYVELLQKEGRTVCFIGDGINDSIALKKANVSISLRGASTIATDTAQVVFMEESLAKLLHLRDVSVDLQRNIDRSWGLIIVPNAICVAGAFFAGFGACIRWSSIRSAPSSRLPTVCFRSGRSPNRRPRRIVSANEVWSGLRRDFAKLSVSEEGSAFGSAPVIPCADSDRPDAIGFRRLPRRFLISDRYRRPCRPPSSHFRRESETEIAGSGATRVRRACMPGRSTAEG